MRRAREGQRSGSARSGGHPTADRRQSGRLGCVQVMFTAELEIGLLLSRVKRGVIGRCHQGLMIGDQIWQRESSFLSLSRNPACKNGI